MPRRAARVDDNQKEIVEALRKVGASVAHTHMVGDGFPDIVTGFRGVNTLMEIKDGSKIPSKRKLTKPEVRWHEEWRGQVVVVNSPREALEALGIEFRGQVG